MKILGSLLIIPWLWFDLYYATILLTATYTGTEERNKQQLFLRQEQDDTIITTTTTTTTSKIAIGFNNITTQQQLMLTQQHVTKKQQKQQLTTVFYNVFTKNSTDEERVKKIVNEQFSFLDQKRHRAVLITSIGHQLSDITNNASSPSLINITLQRHYERGNEGMTLHALWEFCRIPTNNNHATKVVYIHSKGSFHNKPMNTHLRKFLTVGALSKDCDTNLPDSCDVCSSRMSPFPHPHSPGNMWLARCDYIARLVNPQLLTMKNNNLPSLFTKKRQPQHCRGFGRFFYEHWVHSYPYVQSCDLYASKEYLWGYKGVPQNQTKWFDDHHLKPKQKELKPAPRFDFSDYLTPVPLECPTTRKNWTDERIYNYKHLYPNVTIDKSWWGNGYFQPTTTHQ